MDAEPVADQAPFHPQRLRQDAPLPWQEFIVTVEWNGERGQMCLESCHVAESAHGRKDDAIRHGRAPKLRMVVERLTLYQDIRPLKTAQVQGGARWAE
jgi:hypothetical protein